MKCLFDHTVPIVRPIVPIVRHAIVFDEYTSVLCQVPKRYLGYMCTGPLTMHCHGLGEHTLMAVCFFSRARIIRLDISDSKGFERDMGPALIPLSAHAALCRPLPPLRILVDG